MISILTQCLTMNSNLIKKHIIEIKAIYHVNCISDMLIVEVRKVAFKLIMCFYYGWSLIV